MADHIQKQSTSGQRQRFLPERRAKRRNPLIETIRKTFNLFPKPSPHDPSTWRNMDPDQSERLRKLYRERMDSGL
jgi:hypothetical protein